MLYVFAQARAVRAPRSIFSPYSLASTMPTTLPPGPPPTDNLDFAGLAPIMVVDDQADRLAQIKEMLAPRGYEVRAFTSGASALRAAAGQVPALLLLDVDMPGMDGYEVCRRIKADPRLAGVPVIFITAPMTPDERLRGYRLGAVDFIATPLQSEDVDVRVHTQMQMHALQRRLDRRDAQQREEAEQAAAIEAQAAQQRRLDAEQEAARQLDMFGQRHREVGVGMASAALAQELDKPPAAIMSDAEAAELLQDADLPPQSELSELLDDIRSNDQRASTLISQMRDMLDQYQPVFQRVDAKLVVHDAMAVLLNETRLAGVSFSYEASAEHLQVAADRAQLQQVLVNLLLNSIDAVALVAPGARRIAVRACLIDASEVEMVVLDSGPGFGEHLDHAFDAFYTTKGDCAGLGLSIAAAIMNAHDGAIWAEHGPDGGALVRVRMPLATGPAQLLMP